MFLIYFKNCTYLISSVIELPIEKVQNIIEIIIAMKEGGRSEVVWKKRVIG